MRRFFQLVAPFKWHMLVMSLVSLISAMDITIKPYCIKLMIDAVAKLPDGGNVWSAVFYPFAGYLGISILIFIGYRAYGYVNEILMTPALRQHVCLWGVDQLMQRPYGFFQQHFSGALSQKIQDVVSAAPDFIEMAFGRFLVVALAIIMGTLALMNAHAAFGWLMIMWTLVFLGGCWWATPMLARLASNWAHIGTNVTGSIVDWLTNNASVIIFSQQNAERKRIQNATAEAVKAERKQQWANFWVSNVLGVWTVFIIALTLFLLVDYSQKGLISAGDFALVLTINTVLIHQVWQVSGESARFARLWGRIKQAMDSLYNETPFTQIRHDLPAVINGDVVIQNLSFRYDGAKAATLNDICLNVSSGQKVGVVGYSGAGKSTLIHVLLRLFEPQQGTLKLCGFDAHNMDDAQWRRYIGFIPQDAALFHRSLMENIRYGKLDATDEEVIEAAKKARAHDFISKLNKGYHALVGERGVKLSGGQRQRIIIARAILRNAPILILDEATSQLDSMTESDIQNSLWDVMEGKTTLVVAHRLSTLLRMDRIIVMDAGQIVEDGSHITLLAKGGVYAALWNAQVGDFLGDTKG